MSRFRVKTLADSAAFDSELFVARNLGTQLQNSSYGHFHQYLKQCGFKEELLNSFRLPRIIVVGGRSAGKSSLLESITKCPIFPRHRDFCTKAPIELRMKNSPTVSEPQVSISYHGRSTRHLKAAHQILAEVHDIMQGIDGIDDKPIKIKICQADVPTFEVVDLPGLQSYPEQQEKATTNLVTKYLSKPNTLVLCVLDATTPAFDNSSAIKLIRTARKLSHTVVAMTKSDLVISEEEYVPKIFDRILGQSSDNEHLQELACCVAVSNRPAGGDSLLADADVREREVFAKMLRDPAEAFASKQIQKQLRDGMTVQNLILHLDRMFHDYILNNWMSTALGSIAKDLKIATSALEALGPPVEELTAAGVFETVMKQVSQRVICDKLAVLLPKIGNRTWLPRRSGTSLAQVLQCAHPWGSVQWADKIVRVCCSAQMMLSMMCDEDDLAEPLQNHFSDIFQNNLPPRLQRFSTLQESIVDELVPALAAAVMAAVRPKLERMVEATLADLYTFKSPLSADTIGRVEYLDRIVAGVIISHFIQVMQDEAASPNLMRLPETFKLEEAKEVQEQRAQLHDKISRLKTADSQISHIEDAFNTPDSPAAALVAAVNGGFGPETQQHSASDVQSVVPQSGHQSLPVSTSPVSVAAPTLTALPPATAPAAATATPNTAIGPSTTAAIAATATSPAASVGPAVVATAAASPPAVNASAAATTPTALPATPARVLTTGTPTAAAAEMEAELEDVPISPASVADSFVHVK